MLDTPEGARLTRLYDTMRLRLLDLSRRNQLLNYKLGGRSKRQLQIVNVPLEGTYRRLTSEEAMLRIAALPEPDEIPLEERTAEFRALLDRARVTDPDYLAGVDAIDAAGQDDAALERLERRLRDRVREELGLPPRPSRKEFDRGEHARTLGIDPSPDLVKRAGNGDGRALQTMLFPDELESVMEKISADANLSEQETGVSTLFVAIGFLEWYESDASDKRTFAPLLMLPVRIEKQKLKGKAAYSLSTREAGAEPNLSLQKYVEQHFGRQIPDFEAGDEDAQPSIDRYLDEVSSTVENLKRWRVRRWMVLGHFAFGRFAMFADLDPAQWGNPVANVLVRSIVSGAEQGRAPDALPGVPDDYAIDDPEIEAVAPFLIQDADASQHSALVDVMKGKNLVVQGPPGTGKSQTITNVIANALAAGRRVLFLAEKQAALQVVKRRLDQAGLGEFCLELHSDKAAAKSVVASIRARHDLGTRRSSRPVPFSDATWAQSRAEVSEYAEAMHAEAPDGATPFSLIWRALRGRSVYAGVIEGFAKVELPMDLLEDPARRDHVRGDLGLLAEASASFAANFGDPRLSPWNAVEFGEVRAYDARRFVEAVLALGMVADQLIAAIGRHGGLGVRDEADLEALASFQAAETGDAPAAAVAAIADLDPPALEEAMAARSALLRAKTELEALGDLRHEESGRLGVAVAHVSNARSIPYLDQAPAEAYGAAAAGMAQAIALADSLEAVSSLLGFSGNDPASHFRAIATAGVIAGMTPPAQREWVGALPHAEAAAVAAADERWRPLCDAEDAWAGWLTAYDAGRRPDPAVLEALAAHVRAVGVAEESWAPRREAEEGWAARLPGYDAGRRPNPAQLESAASALRKGGLGRALAALTGSARDARELIRRLGFPGEPDPADLDALAAHIRAVAAAEDRWAPLSDAEEGWTARLPGYRAGRRPDPADLEALAAHVRAVAEFEGDPLLQDLFGATWNGLRTPVTIILAGLRVRDMARGHLTVMPGGQAVLERLLALDADGYASATACLDECRRFLTMTAEGQGGLSEEPAAEVVAWARGRAAALADFLAVDPGRTLEGMSATFRSAAAAHAAMGRTSAIEAAYTRHPLAGVVASLEGLDGGLEAAAAALAWIKSVRTSRLRDEAKRMLASDRVAEGRAALREAARDWATVVAARRRAAAELEDFEAAHLATGTPTDLSTLVGSLAGRREEFADFASLRRLRRLLAAAGLGPFLARLNMQELEPGKWVPILDALVADRRAAAARRVRKLAASNGSILDARRRAFADRDLAKIGADRATVRARLMTASPPVGSNQGPRKTWTGMLMLQNEFVKSKRFTPVRQVLARAGDAVQALQPCFMMSPLSLAKFVRPGSLSFDLLVIDEASQMKPEDALGGMLRAGQIVVVGDAKQLPPTDFFSRGSAAAPEEGGDEQEDLDAESILEACEATFGERRRLKWHYRSRCESLIAFSNEAFYEGGLITFPMAKPGSFSIDLVAVNGTNSASRNPAEAEMVAEETIGFMRHHADLPDEEVPSLGIIAVNVEQRELLLEKLRRLSHGDELVERFMEKVEAKGEPFFVKNLETVQGDERDHIFISLTYGRRPGAPALAQNFGPIGRKQGHRRLNVLFTRARLRIGLFASFGSADVRPSETSSEGVRALKRYLAYVETQGRAAVRGIGGEPDSDFEVEVATRLRARGYGVEMQVGVSSFRIDLGVRHPDHPERFLAGVECDGAAFHSSKSARDRDRLREAMLNGLGWDLVRIWSTDWYDDPDLETEKVVRKLEELRRRPPPAVASYRPLRSAGSDPAEDADVDANMQGDPGLAPDSASEISDEFGDEAVADGERGTDAGARTSEGAPGPYGLLSDDGPLTPVEASALLDDFRERFVRFASPEWEPQRSILRPAMIEALVGQRVADPADWYVRVPQYLRSGTAAWEKERFLEAICDVVARIGTKLEASPRLAASPAMPEHGPRAGAVTSAASTGYVVADPAAVVRPDRERFYDAGYLPTLRAMTAHVLAVEAPIHEDLLVDRIARAHGQQRSGWQIRRCVLAALPVASFSREEEDGRKVVWANAGSADGLTPFRHDPTGSRDHGDIPIRELASLAVPLIRLRMDDDSILKRMADAVQVARLREGTRTRMQAAIAIARTLSNS